MLKNYIIIAWRNLIKHRFYAAVNIIGLAAGIGFTLLIAAYVWSELQVNAFLKNRSNQFIIQSDWKNPDQGIYLTSIGALAKELKQTYPSLVKNYYRWDGIGSAVSREDKVFREGIQICDSTMFEMYGFKLLQGDANRVFEHPFALVLTNEKALKYFGRTDVVGETLTIESFSGSKQPFSITGVMEKPAKNSVTFITEENDNGFYIATKDIGFFGRNIDNWINPYVVSYVELNTSADPKTVEKAMASLLKKNAPPDISENLRPYLVSLDEYHLSANSGLIKKLLYALSGIAVFILLMAVINFINMTVSRSAGRLREIGVRKVLGGVKRQLITQFLIESILIVLLATIFGLLFYALAKDFFGSILVASLPALMMFPPVFVLALILFIFFLGLLAGIYPAFVLSSLKSVESLKGKLSSVKEKVMLRKSLVGFQFATATIVLISAIIITQQVKLFFSKDLGYDKDFIISVPVPRNWTLQGVRQMEIIRNKLASLPAVSNVSLSYEVPNGNNAGVFALYRHGTDPSMAVQTQSIFTDEYYAATYGIKMKAGVFYGQPAREADSLNVVINERMANAMGWKHPHDAIGQQVINKGGSRIFTIAGVCNDFHFESMQEEIKPMTFYNVAAFTAYRLFSIKLKPGDLTSTIAAVEKQWHALLPGAPFEYTFLDETLSMLYRTEIQLQKASYVATSLSMIIVLLGILGLVSLSVQKRLKEIGIRKVLGSTVKNIIALFMKEILVTLVIAGLVACPIAWCLMKSWLAEYVYRIKITAFPFLVAISLLAFITAIFVIAQTIKTALTNPVKILRTE